MLVQNVEYVRSVVLTRARTRDSWVSIQGEGEKEERREREKEGGERKERREREERREEREREGEEREGESERERGREGEREREGERVREGCGDHVYLGERTVQQSSVPRWSRWCQQGA